MADDISGGRLWFRRRFLPRRKTTNVVAELGPPDAERTLVVLAHHDAAHAGLILHPELGRAFWRLFPRLNERTNTSPPLLWGAVGGPAAVAVGALLGLRPLRRAGAGAAEREPGARGVAAGGVPVSFARCGGPPAGSSSPAVRRRDGAPGLR